MDPQNAVGLQAALLVVNRPSGAGRTRADLENLQHAFQACFAPLVRPTFAVTETHAEVAQQTQSFLASVQGPCCLIAGGGGGTNRALVQGLMEQVEKGALDLNDVQVSSLRLGSGNVVPKYFRLALEPERAIQDIAVGALLGRTYPCRVYRCTLHYSNGEAKSYYGITLAGVGQFARVPNAIIRWKRHHPRLMAWAAQIVTLETLNTWQYVTFTLLRALFCLFDPRLIEWIEVRHAGNRERLRLLTGFLINLNFPQLPIRGGCDLNEASLRLCLLPYEGRFHTLRALAEWQNLDAYVRKYRITAQNPIELIFLNGDSTLVALDEDTFPAPAQITFELAGTVKFVAGLTFGGNGHEPVY